MRLDGGIHAFLMSLVRVAPVRLADRNEILLVPGIRADPDAQA